MYSALSSFQTNSSQAMTWKSQPVQWKPSTRPWPIKEELVSAASISPTRSSRSSPGSGDPDAG
eukprot:CAMPEP_0115092392 /NCGR_PEP_ID=MMETSP0227-20121206/26736_1 /TAXON_ID=89957 /ORGANISM="Polarella glacialis, Strain CCMP 1383" /LENGTH=62 /DNA_ID=CAMNT_0002484197 /DNA_START=934 /DNA_END=1119 /DNA_ORIENTATION=-